MRREYELTEEQLEQLMVKPQPYLIAGGVPPISLQERANIKWAALGEEMGFQPMTVQPVQGKGGRFFTAVPTQ